MPKYPRTSFHLQFVALVIIVGSTLATYFPALSNDFVMWDDDRMIYTNPNMSVLTPQSLGKMFTTLSVTRQYSPLATFTYSLTYQLGGLKPFGYHLSSFLFHILNAALLFFLLQKLLRFSLATKGIIPKTDGNVILCAMTGALLWALHPLRVETVAWAGGNFYPQALFFLLLSVLAYLEGNETVPARRSLNVAAVIFYILAVLSHPIVITAVIAFFILDVYPLRKTSIPGSTDRWKILQRLCAEKMPFLAVGIIFALLTVMARLNSHAAATPLPSFAEFGVWDRWMQAQYILAYYVWRPWVPFNLSPVYATLANFNPSSPPFIASAAAVFVTAAFLFVSRKTLPRILPLIFITYAIILLPVLGLTEHPHYPSDRYSMIPAILWSVLLSGGLMSLRRHGKAFLAAISIGLVAAAILGVLSHRQTKIWHNTPTLFNHMLNVLGDDPYRQDIYARFGFYHAFRGEYPLAEKYFKLALTLNPKNEIMQYYLYVVYYKEKRSLDAVHGFIRLAQRCRERGLYPDALALFKTALHIAKQNRHDLKTMEFIEEDIKALEMGTNGPNTPEGGD